MTVDDKHLGLTKTKPPLPFRDFRPVFAKMDLSGRHRDTIEMALVIDELGDAIANLELAAELRGKFPDHQGKLIAGSLYRDAIIGFIGCFGKRKLNAEIYDQPGEAEQFQELYGLRDSYAAHPTGAMRQVVMVGYFEKMPDGSLNCFQAGAYTVRHNTRDPEELRQLAEFMRKALRAAEAINYPRYHEFGEALAALSKAAILAMPDAETPEVPLSQARRNRAGSGRSS